MTEEFKSVDDEIVDLELKLAEEPSRDEAAALNQQLSDLYLQRDRLRRAREEKDACAA